MKNKILVVEDDRLTLKIIDFILTKIEFNIVISKDGADAIKRFNKIEPDLVITDIMLPFKSGLEVVQHIKTISPQTPVVVISSLDKDDSVIKKAFEFNVERFISKPFSQNELASIVKSLLK